jgi:trk system potassium uptake protein
MNILILGSGRVASTLASELSKELHNVTVIDENIKKLEEIQVKYDLSIVQGHPSYPDVLRKAEADIANVIIAVSENDELNMVACQVGYSLFNIPLKIARIKSPHYFIRNELFSDQNMPIDVFVSPEKIISRDLAGLISFPRASHVFYFCNKKLLLLGFRVEKNSILINHRVKNNILSVSNLCVRLLYVYRGQQSIECPEYLKEDDEILILLSSFDQDVLANILWPDIKRIENVMIGGGGEIGACLARKISATHEVKIIDIDERKCKELSQNIDGISVLNGNIADRDLLINENIDQADIFLALSNNDESNILSSLQAKFLGALRVITLINQDTYIDILEKGSIDVAFAPQQATLSVILSHIRTGGINRVETLRHGKIEIVEVKIDAKQYDHMKLIGKEAILLDLPDEVELCGIERGEHPIIDFSKIEIEDGDLILFLLYDRAKITQLENFLGK